MIKLVIEGDPIAKTRHRCGCRGKYPVAYDPQVKSSMKPMRKLILKWWNEQLDNPDAEIAKEAVSIGQGSIFFVYLQFYMPISRSCNLGLTNLKLWGINACTDKPDFDNLAKFYTDCMTGIIWPDDRMIVWGASHKVRYSKNPRTEITIMSKKELTLDEHQLNVLKIFSPDDVKEFMCQANDLRQFWSFNAEYFRDDDQIPGEPILSEATLLLSKFASKFADKLKKISKLDPK